MFCKKGAHRIHRKMPGPESLFYKFTGLSPATLLKKRLWHKCFPVNFVKFLRALFFIEHICLCITSGNCAPGFCYMQNGTFNLMFFETFYLSSDNLVKKIFKEKKKFPTQN